ncbi:Ubiquinone biosynthesis protein coq7 [Globisporangium polare]
MQKAIDMNHSKETRDIISMHAYKSGLKAGALAAAVAATGVYTANTHWTAFRTRLGVSGKWALVVSSFLGVFTVVAEKRILHGARNPELYLASLDPNYVSNQVNVNRNLKFHERAANFLYDHPYRMLAGIGVPLVGGIFAYQSTNHAIARSQQIMHTRLYGQGAVVALLLSSMAFHDYMLKRGRFVAPQDAEEEEVQQQQQQIAAENEHHHAL